MEIRQKWVKEMFHHAHHDYIDADTHNGDQMGLFFQTFLSKTHMLKVSPCKG